METSTVIKIMGDRCTYELHHRQQQSIYINDRRPILVNFKTTRRKKSASTELRIDSHGWPIFPGVEKSGQTTDYESS